MDDRCYSIQKVSQLNKILHEHSKSWTDFDEQLKTNNAFIYRLSDGKILLLPNHVLETDDGILFQNEVCYSKFLHEDRFPIENPEMTIVEKYQSKVIGFKNNIYDIIQELKNAVGDKDSLSTHFEEHFLVVLLERSRKKWKTMSLENKLNASLALGEYLCRVNNGKWLLLKRYGAFNPYYVPAIEYGTSNFLILLDHVHSYYENPNIALDKFANLAKIKTPINSRQNTFAFEYKIP
jgi:hypothetical protein